MMCTVLNKTKENENTRDEASHKKQEGIKKENPKRLPKKYRKKNSLYTAELQIGPRTS
jgi:DNA invertase Pin-like site-specific DNA recombinase